ncbi:MAG: hypothetical protein WBL61_19360 [Bryobacteraceae bacterium]
MPGARNAPGAGTRSRTRFGGSHTGIWCILIESRENGSPVLRGHPNVRLALNVAGPGRYDKTGVMNIVVQTGFNSWNFSRDKDDCVFHLTRVDKSGVEGSVTCTSAVPFTGMKFYARP